MKRNASIFLLIAISVMSLSVAYYQWIQAREYKLLALENELKWREAMEMAEQQRIIAEHSRVEAEHQRLLAVRNEEQAMWMQEIAAMERQRAVTNASRGKAGK